MLRFQTKYHNLAHLPVYIQIPYNYVHKDDPSTGIKDLENYLQIITHAKKIKLHIIPRALNRADSPF